MTPRELRRAMRQRRKELRRSLVEARGRARARAEQAPQVRRERGRRNLRRALGLALLALLLSLIRCDCQPPPPPASGATPGPDAGPRDASVPKAIRKPLQGKVQPRPRAAYEPAPAAPAGWIQELRLQVAARSPRLAECFTGAQGPGALRWTAAVNPESGVVSDHELVTVGTGESLPRDQRECLIKVLSTPTYHLNAEAGTAPDRVGMVIEF